MTRVIAIDWSGAKSRVRSKIWLAEVRGGRLVRLEPGRTRHEVVEHLITDARDDAVVGLDFAFSFPRWFVEERGAKSIDELWEVVAEQGEEWLHSCPHPFWGKPGKRKPGLKDPSCHFRRTEEVASQVKGVNPKSVFQIGGAGQVGPGSIRGMRHLATLRDEGFSIWPFHRAWTPLVIEIYPRLLTGTVRKSDGAARTRYLAEGFPEIDDAFRSLAASSEDAFDAAVSAVVMGRHLDEISALSASRDRTDSIEGRIWWPPAVRKADAGLPPGRGSRPPCPFCDIPDESVVAESRHALAVRDRYPVSPGHTLVVPKAHTETLFAQSAEVQADVWGLVARVRDELRSRCDADGFNVGINDGRAAGQTVEHAHVHVIPRADGDLEDPRGGIRWVLPERAVYWDR